MISSFRLKAGLCQIQQRYGQNTQQKPRTGRHGSRHINIGLRGYSADRGVGSHRTWIPLSCLSRNNPQVQSQDDLPVSFDVHHLVNMAEAERRPYLTGILEECPSEAREAFVDKYLRIIKQLNL